MPAVNQIELTPFLQRRETRRAVRASTGSSSRRTARSRAASGSVTRSSRRSPTRVGRSPAQVLLRWGVQHGIVVLPKSIRRERIAENGALFDFTLDAASACAQLDALEEGLATGWDPATMA